MARKRASEPGNTAGAAYSARFWLWRALLVAGWSLLILYIVAGAFTLGRAIANGASPSSDLFFDALALDIPSRQSLAFVITAGIVALALLVASVTAALVDGRKPAVSATLTPAAFEPTEPADTIATIPLTQAPELRDEAQQPESSTQTAEAEQSEPAENANAGTNAASANTEQPAPTPEVPEQPEEAPEPMDTKSKEFVPRVFISHSSADNDFGLALQKELTAVLGGASDVVWYDASGSPEDDGASGLLGGDPWWTKIREELGARNVFVVILSPDAVASPWVRREIDIAWVNDNIIVPVLRRDCSIPDDLKTIHYVSFVYADPVPGNRAFTQLLAAIKLGELRRRDPEARILRPMGMPHVPNLVGRDAEVTEVERLLHTSATSVICAQGMPGVGKSAFAAWITERVPNDSAAFPGGAAWIPCNELTSDDPLQEVYARLAKSLGRDDIAQNDPQERQRKLVEVLSNRPRTLLTFDNIEPGFPVQALVELLAIRHFTALLLTTTEIMDVNVDHLIHLDPLAATDGVQLFLESRARKGYQAPDDVNEFLHVVTLVNTLGRLPLAIYLTAGYCATQKVRADRMVEIVKAEHLNATAFADTAYTKTGLKSCFERSLRALPNHCQSLFAGLCLFAGASLPRSAGRRLSVALSDVQPYLTHVDDKQGHSSGPAPAASLALHTMEKTVAGDSAITALVNAALVDAIEGGRLRIHPLLREYAFALFQTLDADIQDILGSAMADFWVTFAEQHATEFGDLELAAESDGIAHAMQWAREHGAEGIIERIQSSQANVGTRSAFRFLSIFSWIERVEMMTESWPDPYEVAQPVSHDFAHTWASITLHIPRRVRSAGEQVLDESIIGGMTYKEIELVYTNVKDRIFRVIPYLLDEATYAQVLDREVGESVGIFKQADRADAFLSRAANQFEWARSDASTGLVSEATVHIHAARDYASQALALGSPNALALIKEIDATLGTLANP